MHSYRRPSTSILQSEQGSTAIRFQRAVTISRFISNDLKAPSPVSPFQLVLALKLEESPHFAIGDKVLVKDEYGSFDKAVLTGFQGVQAALICI